MINANKLAELACTVSAVVFLVSGTVTKSPEYMQKYQTGLLFLILAIQFEKRGEEKK